MVLLIQNLSYRKWRWNWRRSRNGEHRRRFGGANSVLQQHPYSRSFSAPAFLRASFPIRSLLLWPPWTTTTTNSLSRSVSSSSFWTQFSREKTQAQMESVFFLLGKISLTRDECDRHKQVVMFAGVGILYGTKPKWKSLIITPVLL